MRPGLSVAMIVRDEAALLPGCLDSIAGLADEVCIVDTGSKDGSLALAQARGCRTATFAWCNDFSAARNASLALCREPWIFVIDADERLDSADHAALHGLLDAGDAFCYRFTTRNYTNNSSISEFQAAPSGDPQALGFAGWFPSAKVRLFPNRPEARFRGQVHELVNDALLEIGITIRDAPMPVYHYPLLKSEAELLTKRWRYIELGLAKLREAPDNPHAHAELGNQYVELGQYAQAIASYQQALRLMPDNVRCLTDLGGVLHMIGQQAQAQKILEVAVRTDPNHIDAWRNLGVVQAAGGAWELARASFEKAHRLAPEDVELHRYRGVACLETGDAPAAADAAKAGLTLQPDHIALLDLFCTAMLKAACGEEALVFLNRLPGLPEASLKKAMALLASRKTPPPE